VAGSLDKDITQLEMAATLIHTIKEKASSVMNVDRRLIGAKDNNK